MGLKIKNYSDNYEASNSRALKVNELSDVFFVSSGKISEARKFGLVNPAFYRLFPSLQSIGYKFMRNILSLSKSSGIELNEDFCMQFSAVANDIEDNKVSESQVKTLKEQIISSLQAKRPSESFVSLFDDKYSYIDGTIVKVTKKAAVISIDHDKVPEDVQEKILELLKTP